MKWKPISESTNPYWDKANLYYKEKHQTVEEWVHANVPKSYWEPSLRWIEKHWHVEPADRIDLLDEQEMEDMKDDIMFFTSENFNRGQKMKWYRLYKESRKPSDEIRWNVINIQEAEIIGKKSEGKKSPGKITIKFALKGQSPYKNKTDTYLLQRAKYIIGEFQVDYKEPDSSFSSKEKVSDEITLLDFLNIGELIHFEIFRRSTKDLYMDFDELKEKVLSTITEEIEKLKGKSWVDDALDHWGGYSTDHTRD